MSCRMPLADFFRILLGKSGAGLEAGDRRASRAWESFSKRDQNRFVGRLAAK